ncbi:unnamed protein product [Phyllotreta striolata]|uniref:Retrotransposon gag domain-containing protein n=1 Tax=Phyllotreta striolata TaxID=444603 RepID=A0A9P0DTL2_PHYSR|nr:unnamed protein product [Phyllotreta striolata]
MDITDAKNVMLKVTCKFKLNLVLVLCLSPETSSDSTAGNERVPNNSQLRTTTTPRPHLTPLSETIAKLEDNLKTTTEGLRNTFHDFAQNHQQSMAQIGRSLVAMHKENQATNERMLTEIQKLLETQESTRRPTTDSRTEHRIERPVFVSPSPIVPKFKSDGTKHPVKFIEELDSYLKKMEIPPAQQLNVVNKALVGAAEDWSTIYKISWLTFEDFRRDFLDCFWSEVEQNRVRHQISTHKWMTGSRHSMEGHFAKYVGMARLLTKPIPEEILLADLMRHFPPAIQSLWMLKENKTLTNAALFLRQQEDISAEGPNHYRGRPFLNHPQNPYKKIRTELPNTAHRQINTQQKGNEQRSN